MEAEIKQEVRKYIVENFVFNQAGFELGDEASFLDEGIIDSTGTLELIMFLEQAYQIVVEDYEIVPANLDSVANLTAFILRKMAAQTV